MAHSAVSTALATGFQRANVTLEQQGMLLRNALEQIVSPEFRGTRLRGGSEQSMTLEFRGTRLRGGSDPRHPCRDPSGSIGKAGVCFARGPRWLLRLMEVL